MIEPLERTPFRPGRRGPLGQGRLRRRRPRPAGPARRDPGRPGRRDRRASPGVAGNGQTRARPRSITGDARLSRQRRPSADVEVANGSAGHAIALRASPTSRRTGRASAVAPNLSVTDNLIMKRYQAAPARRTAASWTTTAAPGRSPSRRSDRLRHRRARRSTPRPGSLSGGNLQRLILAREIDAGPQPHGGRPAHPRPGRRARSRRSTGSCSQRRDGGHGDPAHQRGPRRDPSPSRTASTSCTRAGSPASFDAADGRHPGDRPAHERRRGRGHETHPPRDPGSMRPRWFSAGDDPRAAVVFALVAQRRSSCCVSCGGDPVARLPAHRPGRLPRERLRPLRHRGSRRRRSY